MATSDALREISRVARPLIEQWLDIAEQMAGLRNVATAAGLDWSQLKALLKAQIQDERDDDGLGKRVARIVEKAEFASAYADMLGLANMNENNFSRDEFPTKLQPVESKTALGLTEPAVTQGSSLPANTKSVPIPPIAAGSSPDHAATTDAVTSLAASVTPFKLRPKCLNPDRCGGYGTKHCFECLKADASATLQHGALA